MLLITDNIILCNGADFIILKGICAALNNVLFDV